MNAPRRTMLVTSALLVALALLAAPALAAPASADADPAASAILAVEEPPAEEPAPAADDGDHRIGLVDTPRDRFGLLLLGALLFAGALALINARRQLKGEREQATGEFRWR